MNKIIIEFTRMTHEDIPELMKEGMVSPFQIDIEEIVKIDYGNYGTENDRHWWPGWQTKGGPGTTRPVLIIHTKEGIKKVASSSIKFMQYEVKQLPPVVTDAMAKSFSGADFFIERDKVDYKVEWDHQYGIVFRVEVSIYNTTSGEYDKIELPEESEFTTAMPSIEKSMEYILFAIENGKLK